MMKAMYNSIIHNSLKFRPPINLETENAILHSYWYYT
jgi:hypothetical protein